jgi:hypothetical protein
LTLHLEKVHQIFEEKDQLQDKNDVATPPKDFSGKKNVVPFKADKNMLLRFLFL